MASTVFWLSIEFDGLSYLLSIPWIKQEQSTVSTCYFLWAVIFHAYGCIILYYIYYYIIILWQIDQHQCQSIHLNIKLMCINIYIHVIFPYIFFFVVLSKNSSLQFYAKIFYICIMNVNMNSTKSACEQAFHHCEIFTEEFSYNEDIRMLYDIKYFADILQKNRRMYFFCLYSYFNLLYF